MKQLIVLSLLVLLTIVTSFAQSEPSESNKANFFKFDEKMNSIFHDIMTLKLNQAGLALSQVKTEDPSNLLSHYLEDYIDFFHAFVDGKRKDIYDKHLKHKEKHLLLLEQGSEEDPYTLYTQADIHLRWGMIYALFQDNMEAFKSIKQASLLLDKNDKKFPDFLPNKRALGILHTLVGAIPGKYQWGASLVGLEGDVQQGLTELEAVINHGKAHPEFEFNEEVQVIYGMLLLYMGNHDSKAWGQINTAILDHTQNPMAAYILANRFIKTGKSRSAILILDKYPKGDEYHYFAYLDILSGMCKLYQLDLHAETDFNNFLSKYRGDNGIKEAYHRLAWVNLLKGDESKYRYFMSMVEKKGEYNTSPDKTAMNEMEDAKENIIPNKELLQARLLFDGGYYEKAHHTMEACDVKKLKTEAEKIEFYYRKGRIFQEMKKNEEALKNFDECYKLGTKKPYYFTCNALLQAGQIHESRGELDQAKDSYEKCLKEKPDQYQASLHSQAKERLKVLKSNSKK